MIIVILLFGENKRNDFLKFNFTNKFYLIRFIENTIFAIPFIIILIFGSNYISALIALIIAIMLIPYQTGKSFNFVLPTPFSKKPFEFSVGFRKGFVAIIISYLLAIISLIFANFNIGVFSIILLFIIFLSFYIEPENEYFVWSHIITPKQFLWNKIKMALINSSLLIAPVVSVLAIIYYENIYIIGIFLLTGYFVLSTIIVAKYSSYPDKMSVSQGVVFLFSIQLPPLLLIAFPYFYLQSIKKLKRFLK